MKSLVEFILVKENEHMFNFDDGGNGNMITTLQIV